MWPQGDVGSDDTLKIRDKCIDAVDLIQKRSGAHAVECGNVVTCISGDDLIKPLAAGRSEQIGACLMHQVAVQHGMNGVLALGPASNKRDAVADELP